MMKQSIENTGWKTTAILVARFIMAALFAMGVAGKIFASGMMVDAIAKAGFPFPMVLNWLAALFELGLALAYLTGAYFREANLLGVVYLVFLAFAFHFVSHWTDAEGLNFGAFVSHFPMAAGMLFAAVNGPGQKLTLKWGWLK
jgi:putative oxidoreductase